MGKFTQYKIDLKNLPDDASAYTYELDRRFFDAIDHEDVKKGNVKAELEVKKATSSYEIDFHLVGAVQIPCDRCLDEMDQEIDAIGRLIVKFGEEYFEDSDELVIIPESEGAINVAWYLYEFIVLNIPIKHVHEIGNCNKSMVSKYRKHQAVNIADEDDLQDDDDLSDDEDIADDASEEQTDPRWDELKKLKK